MKTIETITDKAVFDSFWLAKHKHLLQSWAWGEVKSNEGWEITRIGIYEQGKMLDVLSLQQKSLLNGLIRFAYLPKISYSTALSGEVLKLLKAFFVTHKIDFVVFEADLHQELKSKLFRNYSDHIQPPQTNIVSLGLSEEQLFMRLDGKYRRNIKKALREGLTVEVHNYNTDPTVVNNFYQVQKEIVANTKFLGRSLTYFQKIWNILGSESKAKILIAKAQNDVVGAYLVVNDEANAYELYGGVTLKGRNLEAGYLLKWEAIKLYNSLGFKSYDHWGVAPKINSESYDSKHELYHISKFKEGFGGEYVEFPQTKVLIISKLKYRLFLIAKLISKNITKLKKNLRAG